MKIPFHAGTLAVIYLLLASSGQAQNTNNPAVAGPNVAPSQAFGPDSDILGLRLSMSSDEIKKYLSNNFTIQKNHEIEEALAVGPYQQTGTFGYYAEITTQQDQQHNKEVLDQANKDYQTRMAAGMGTGNPGLDQTILQTGDLAVERLTIFFLPDQPGVIAIMRHKEFRATQRPLKDVTLKALEEKYGPPDFVGTIFGDKSRSTYSWTTAKKLKSNEETWNMLGFDLIGLEEQTSPNIANLVNIIDGPKKYYSNCGVVLRVVLTVSGQAGDMDHLTAMDATLVDFSKEKAEVDAFAKDFEAKADAAKQQQLSKDANLKPQL